MISPRHEEARKVAAVVRNQLKAQGAISAQDHAVTVLRRMDLGPEACRDLLHSYNGKRTGHERRVRLEEHDAQVTAFFLSGIDAVPIW